MAQAPLDRADIARVPFVACSLNEAVAHVNEPTGTGRAIFFWNAYNVALANDDSDYAALAARADSVFCDGVPVVWAGRRLHPALHWERVYGPDVMAACLAWVHTPPLRHYLLGATPDTLNALQAAITVRFPHAVIVGADSPPFHDPTAEELAERDARIAASGADLVWVGLGTPKQDHECLRLASALPVTALGVGAAFDFLAGTKPQAPAVLQQAGLEWAFRLASEPRRLARRYFWGNPRFVAAVTHQAYRERGRRRSPIG